MNQEQFKNTVFVHKDKFFRFARRILVSDDEAYDVVQDVLMKLWDKRKDLNGIDNIEAYGMRMVNNQCLSRLRKEDIRDKYKSINQSENSSEFDLQEIKPIILNFINQLPEKQRKVIHLRDVEEYELKEISLMLEMDDTAVRVNLTRARQKIKEQINTFFRNEVKTSRVI